VRFERHNLVGDRLPVPGGRDGWDVIICRNVLIYFDRARAVAVVRRLASALVEGGWLALGAADPFVAGQVDLLRPVCVDGQWFHERRREAARPRPGEVAGDVLLDTLARGNASLAVHDFAGARVAYEQGLRLAPDDGEPAYLLGLLHRKEGDYVGAMAWFQRALRLRPSLWPARYLLGSCLDRSGRGDEAAVEFARVLEQLQRGGDVDVLRSRLGNVRGLVLPPAQVASVCRDRLKGRSVPTRR
jgi:tetratricopeptide (TPR) repeat protein